MISAYYQLEQKIEAARDVLTRLPEALVTEFYERLDYSWIYHDNALEGEVLTYHELKAAIDSEIISDVTLIPSYEKIQNHKNAIDFVRGAAQRRKPPIGLDFVKKIQMILDTESQPRSAKAPPRHTGQYRKDNPLHRLYFHEIVPPDKISYQMRKLVQWLVSDEAKKMHPVSRAAIAQHRLIAVFPWPRHSGKVARLLMNAMLLRDGYLPAVIHAIERQRYYEALRQPPTALTALVAESLLATADAANRTLEEVQRSRKKSRKKPVRAAS